MDLELTPKETNDNIDIPVRLRKPTDKERAYQIEMKYKHCQSIPRRITKMMKKSESLIKDFDNVHVVQNDLEILNITLVEFQDVHNAWSNILTEQEKIPAIDWYKEHWQRMVDFKGRMKYWIVVAKYKIGTRGRTCIYCVMATHYLCQ